MNANTFLRAMWGETIGGWVQIWTPQTKRSTGFSDLSGVDRFIEGHRNQDWYTGVGLAAKPCRPQERVTSTEVIAIAGLWADVDYSHPVHQKPNLPPGEEAACRLIYEMPVAPTVLVHTGHGLQAWWWFPSPWAFADAEDRAVAAALSQAWQSLLRRNAQRRGWTIDSTYDLARLMRLPGTFNHKAEPLPVRVLRDDGPREPNEKFLGLVTLDVAPVPSELIGTSGLNLISDAAPPADKLEALKQNSDKFLSALERRRPDLADQSASGYDLNLAAQASAAGWTDQEIASLLIWTRATHGDKLKLREDYYQPTINKARSSNNGHHPDQSGGGGPGDEGLTKYFADLILAQDHFARDGSGNLYVYQMGCYRPLGENHIKRLFQVLLESLGKTKKLECAPPHRGDRVHSGPSATTLGQSARRHHQRQERSAERRDP